MSGLTRRSWLLVFGSGSAAALIAACSKNNNNTPTPDAAAAASCSTNNAMTTIMDNHAHAPHVLTVTPADIMAGVDKTYSIQGAANHDHMVTITAAQFASLAAGGSAGSVMDTSTMATVAGNVHDHVCVIVCA